MSSDYELETIKEWNQHAQFKLTEEYYPSYSTTNGKSDIHIYETRE